MDWRHCMLLVLSWSCLGKCEIIFENNGYSGIIVAIKHRIPEDESLIERIKDIFEKGSKLLHTVTNGKAYFKEITIAIPSSWSAKPYYQNILLDYFSKSHVRIDIENPAYKEIPYTLQLHGCGVQGEYIHITPNFLRGRVFVSMGKVERYLVHEWVHFRYGVFDEYVSPSDERFSPFYILNSKVYPTSCVKDITGWIIAKPNTTCNVESTHSNFRDCSFSHDPYSQQYSASFMYGPDIIPLDKLCDETRQLKHNKYAPTPQNLFCNRTSAWDVVQQHADFNGDLKPIPIANIPATKFRLVRQKFDRVQVHVVLLLDISWSMENENRIEWLTIGANRFLKNEVADGTYLGIVTFGNDAWKLFNLTEVTPNSRSSFQKVYSLSADPGTAIGKALIAGLEVLKNNKKDSIEGGIITLMTDGLENVSPFIRDVLPRLINEKVIVNSIAFGSQSDGQIEELSGKTGGTAYFINDVYPQRATNGLDAAFIESITSQYDIDFQPVLIIRDMRITIAPGRETEVDVYIDSDVDRNTSFYILCYNIVDIDTIVTDPSMKIYDRRSREYTKDTRSTNSIRFIIRRAKVGKWRVKLMNLNNQTSYEVSLTVKSEANDILDPPVRIRTWLSDFKLIKNNTIRITARAEAKKGFHAVIGAKVTGKLEIPDGSSKTATLKDNGYGGDMMANDGAYIGFFDVGDMAGRYVVTGKMTNDGNAKLKKGSISVSASSFPGRSMTREEALRLGLGEARSWFNLSEFTPVDKNYAVDDSRNEEKTETKDLNDFSREGNTFEFFITEEQLRAKRKEFLATQSPSWLLGVRLISVVENVVNLHLEIPATALKIEVKAHNDSDKLDYSSLIVFQYDLNNVTKLPSGFHNITFKVPTYVFSNDSDTVNTIYFRLFALNNDNKIEAVSKIVPISWNWEKFVHRVEQEWKPRKSENLGRRNLLGPIVATVIATIVVAVIIAVVVAGIVAIGVAVVYSYQKKNWKK